MIQKITKKEFKNLRKWYDDYEDFKKGKIIVFQDSCQESLGSFNSMEEFFKEMKWGFFQKEPNNEYANKMHPAFIKSFLKIAKESNFLNKHKEEYYLQEFQNNAIFVFSNGNIIWKEQFDKLENFFRKNDLNFFQIKGE